MKILVIGASGLIGGKIFDYFNKSNQAAGTYFSSEIKARYNRNLFYLDVTNTSVLERTIIDLNPDVIVYSASLSGPDRCEQNPDLAFAINSVALQKVASICEALSKKLIYISSDYVFSTNEEYIYEEQDEPKPINVFGRTKREAELYLLSRCSSAAIIRPSLVYGYSQFTENRGMVNNIIESSKKNEELPFDNVSLRYPLLSDDLCKLVEVIIQQNLNGIFHASGEVGLTKYEFAQLVLEKFSLSDSQLKIVNESDMDLPAPRPGRVKLCTKKARSLGIFFSDPSTGLEVYKKQAGCTFKMIYSTRSDMVINGQSVSDFRIEAGKILASKTNIPIGADCVIPIPESGIYPATGYAAESKIPLFFGIVRDYFTQKTLFSPSLDLRLQALSKKLIAVDSVIRGKSIILVDEAVLSGSTLKVVVKMLRGAGAKEIHIRIPSPYMLSSCTGKVLNEHMSLLSKQYGENPTNQNFNEYFESDSFECLELEDFKSILQYPETACLECFKKRS